MPLVGLELVEVVHEHCQSLPLIQSAQHARCSNSLEHNGLVSHIDSSVSADHPCPCLWNGFGLTCSCPCPCCCHSSWIFHLCLLFSMGLWSPLHCPLKSPCHLCPCCSSLFLSSFVDSENSSPNHDVHLACALSHLSTCSLTSA